MAAWLMRALKQSGFVTDHAPDASTAEDFLANGIAYDAMVLDLGLPDKHGLSVLSEMRSRGNSTPVLILTAQGGLPDRVRGLNLGADDYLAKPFALEELEARLAALGRRTQGHRHAQLHCGSLSYSDENRAFTLGGVHLQLTSREHAALYALMVRRGAPVRKSQIYDKVFPHESGAGPGAVDQVLHRVRRKLAHSDVHVVTLRGLGYMLEGPTSSFISGTRHEPAS